MGPSISGAHATHTASRSASLTGARYHAGEIALEGRTGPGLRLRLGDVNAVEYFAERLAPEAVRRLAALRVIRFETHEVIAEHGLELAEAYERVLARWAGDL